MKLIGKIGVYPAHARREEEMLLNQKKKRRNVISAVIITSILMLAGCGVSGPKVTQYPTTKEAMMHFEQGNRALENNMYDLAINEFKQSISQEPSPFLPYARLATAYYSNQNFTEAALEFENVTNKLGGAESGGPFPIMQALSLMRSGDGEKAKQLLKEWSSSSIVADGIGGFYSVGGRLHGIWKVAASYLLGDIAEDEYFRKAPQDDLSFHYLIVGINNVVRDNPSKAEKNLRLALDTAGNGTWRRVIATAELELIKLKR